MDNLKEYKNKQIVDMILNKKIAVTDIVDSGICPTCFNKENNNVLYGDNMDKMIFESNDFECFLVGNPRTKGHMIVSAKKHYKNMSEIPDDLCSKMFIFSKKMMNIIKKVYNAESVYLCTMCDGAMNHFHIQLIPRYSFEKRGSRNFVKPRQEYKEDKEKIQLLRSMILGECE